MFPANTTAPEYSERIDKCATCNLDLPLRLPKPGEHTTLWTCTGCGARYHAVLEEHGWAELGRKVRPAKVQFDQSKLARPPKALEAFARNMFPDGDYAGKRASEQHFLLISVPVIPVDDRFRPTGEVFMAVMRGVSTTGIALVSTRAVDTKFAVVELPQACGEKLQLAMRVSQCRPTGRFFEIAGPFVTRMDD